MLNSKERRTEWWLPRRCAGNWEMGRYWSKRTHYKMNTFSLSMYIMSSIVKNNEFYI